MNEQEKYDAEFGRIQKDLERLSSNNNQGFILIMVDKDTRDSSLMIKDLDCVSIVGTLEGVKHTVLNDSVNKQPNTQVVKGKRK